MNSHRKIRMDCDFDTLLIEVAPQGQACHKGTYSCFEVEP
jgi:phosphoribosyl-ATP pyrophosphohydrolase/phosphoribosyl-AMP cyclohydrolase